MEQGQFRFPGHLVHSSFTLDPSLIRLVKSAIYVLPLEAALPAVPNSGMPVTAPPNRSTFSKSSLAPIKHLLFILARSMASVSLECTEPFHNFFRCPLADPIRQFSDQVRHPCSPCRCCNTGWSCASICLEDANHSDLCPDFW